jgi:phage terminase large subunit-like protein
LSTGEEAIRFIESYVTHAEGDSHGAPFILAPFQRDIVRDIYDGGAHRVYVGMPRGCGKTELVAALGCFELLGGRCHSPVVIVAASSRDQADLLFGCMRQMCKHSKLSAYCEVFDSEILLRDAPGRCLKVAAEARTLEGHRPTAFLADELHCWTGATERVFTVLSAATAKRANSLQVAITTAGSDMTSLAGRLYQHGRKVEAGEVDDPGFLFRWREVPKDTDINDDAALREVYAGTESFMPIENVLAARAEHPEYEYRRYFCNQWVSAPERWLPSGSWEACSDAARVIPDGAEIIVGFDGSWSGDSTALMGVTVEEPHHVFVLGLWERPPDAGDSWRVDVGAVEARVRQVCEQFKVRHVVADSYRWQRSISLLASEGIPAVDFPTHSVPRMVGACHSFTDAVLTGKLTHDGDPRLAAHIANCVVKEDASGPRITRQSGQQIDAAYASVIAHDVLISTPPKKESVYERRGLIVI